MLGLMKRKTAADVIESPRQWEGNRETAQIIEFRPAPVQVVMDELPDLSEYRAVAEVLGFNPPELEARRLELLRRELIGVMLDQGYPIYNNKEVHDYMAKLAEKDDKVFVWCRLDALSEYDHRERMMEIRFRDPLMNVVATKRHGQFILERYRHAVPINILKRATAVKKVFGDRVRIWVSDYAVVRPDPFVAATLDGCEHVVFGMWDEPGFEAIGRDRV